MPAPSARQRPPTHACTAPVYIMFDVEDETLAECCGPDRHLRTRCACGAVAGFDPEAWIARKLGWRLVASFSGSLRCPCGRRHARFEVWPGTLAQSGLKIRSAAELYD